MKKVSKKLAESVIELNFENGSASDNKDIDMKMESDLDYISRYMRKYPILKMDQEKLITGKIFESKIKILTAIAANEPIFLYYLDIMIKSTDVAEQNKSDVDEFLEDEDSPFFENYLNSEKDNFGKERKFSEFRSQIIQLKNLCFQLHSIRTVKLYDLKLKEVASKFEEINFSWTKLQKDGLLELVPSGDQNYLDYRTQFNTMFNHNMRLAIDVAKNYFPFNSNRADLVQEANRGLMKAIERFDPRRGFKFSTFAFPWVKQYVGRFASQFWTIRVPVHMYEKISKLRSIEREHPEWNEEQIAKELHGTVEYVRKLRLIKSQSYVASLDEPLNNDPSKDGADTLGTFITDLDANVEKVILDVMTHDEIVKIMKERLTAREYEIMARRLGFEDREEETLEQIAIFFQLSRERIRQLEVAAIKKLRNIKFFQQLRLNS